MISVIVAFVNPEVMMAQWPRRSCRLFSLSWHSYSVLPLSCWRFLVTVIWHQTSSPCAHYIIFAEKYVLYSKTSILSGWIEHPITSLNFAIWGSEEKATWKLIKTNHPLLINLLLVNFLKIQCVFEWWAHVFIVPTLTRGLLTSTDCLSIHLVVDGECICWVLIWVKDVHTYVYF